MEAALIEDGRYYSREEYREWCDKQPRGRFERIDGQIIAMASERLAHVRMKANVYMALRRAVTASGADCEAFADGVTVESGDSDYEPDALVNCGERVDGEAIAAPNPIIIVEVLSPGTASTDTGAKLAGYFRIPSVSHYLIVHPSRRTIIHHRREEHGILTQIVASGSIIMDPPGLTITVEELYGTASPG